MNQWRQLAPDPAYVIGRDSSAEAIIVDNDSDRPRTRRLRDGSFHVCMPGTNGIAFRIEASTDLRSWTTVTIGGVTDGAIHFADPNSKDMVRRFYRVSPEPAPLLEDRREQSGNI